MNDVFAEGSIILIDKPLTWTSFDAVKRIRGGLKIKKIGHAGTLDPLATGLLVICTGKCTKMIDQIQNGEKEYQCTMVIGKSTPSYDLETEFDKELPYLHVTEEMVREVLQKFIGNIEQTPPAHSAVRINGQRAYQLARKGVEPEMKVRSIFIEDIKITDITLPEISLNITCSKGTYIRSLVRDIGLALNTCAYMSKLRRTRIGEYQISNAISPNEFVEKHKTINDHSI